jgi:hypothetical protein
LYCISRKIKNKAYRDRPPLLAVQQSREEQRDLQSSPEIIDKIDDVGQK